MSTLPSNDFPVPLIRIEPMNDERIYKFLQVYIPEKAEMIWGELEESPQLDMFRVPYLLNLLVGQVRQQNTIPKGRSELFTGFVRHALRREIQNENPLFQLNRSLLTKEDQWKIINSRWQHSHDLPEGGALMSALSHLAFKMQEDFNADGSHVRVNITDVAKLLNWEEAQQSEADSDNIGDNILNAGLSLNILDVDLMQLELLFFHQLLQEFFAARLLAMDPDYEKVRVEWRVGRIKPSLDEILANIAVSDPLPPSPTTGWEETMLFAAAMSHNQEQFVHDLMSVNLNLAARSALSPDVTISVELLDEIRQALLQRISDSEAELRVRLDAGLVLGNLGDPRFKRFRGVHGDYLLPPLVTMPAGDYIIGDEDSDYPDEKPMHKVRVECFQLSAFPVTNAEYKMFIHAGGYEDERWWRTPSARTWRINGSNVIEIKKYWRDLHNRFFGSVITEEHIRDLQRNQEISPQEAEDALTLVGWTAERMEDWIEQTFLTGPRKHPRFWFDSRFNNPAQPVVGVSWYEANAYCAWLSSQVKAASAGNLNEFRLLTEAEFEAAARGLGGRRYAYGSQADFQRANTLETHVRFTSPVGIFHNSTPEGAFDLAGNVWSWTSTR